LPATTIAALVADGRRAAIPLLTLYDMRQRHVA